jgi:hypothetical protein
MNKLYIFLNIFEAIYVYYMMNHFKTKYSLHLPIEKITQYHHFLMHPIDTGKYESKICPLGQLVGVLLPIWILLRVIYRDSKYTQIINNLIWIAIFILSFIMNINAFIYFVPAFLIELYFYFYFSKNSIKDKLDNKIKKK